MSIDVALSGKKIDNSNASFTTADVTTSASGSGFLVFVIWYGSATFTSLADSKGNTYTQIGSEVAMSGDSTFKGRLYYVQNGTGGANHNWTPTLSAGAITTLFYLEVTGGATADLLDQAPAALQDTATPFLTNTTGTTAQASELLLVFYGTYSAGSETITWGNSFTQVIAEGDGAANVTGGIGKRVVAATGTYTGSITSDQASETFGFIVSLRDAGSGPTNTPVTATVTQTQTPTVEKVVTRTISANQTQTPTHTRAVAKSMSATSTQTPSNVSGAGHAMTISATNTQSAPSAPTVSGDVEITATHTQTPSVKKALDRNVSVTQTQTIVRTRSLARAAITVTQTQSPSQSNDGPAPPAPPATPLGRGRIRGRRYP